MAGERKKKKERQKERRKDRQTDKQTGRQCMQTYRSCKETEEAHLRNGVDQSTLINRQFLDLAGLNYKALNKKKKICLLLIMEIIRKWNVAGVFFVTGHCVKTNSEDRQC